MAVPQVGYLTNYAEEKLIKHLFSISSFSIPDLYLAYAVYDAGAGLTTGWGETGAAGAGTVEPGAYGDTNYARIHVPASDWISAALSSGAFATSSSLEPTYHFQYVRVSPALAFPDPSLACGDGAPRFAAWFDAATGGNCLAYHAINTGSTGSPIPRPGFPLSTAAESLWLGMPTNGQFDWDTTANPNSYASPWAQPVIEGLLNHMVGKASYTPPSPFYLGNHSSNTPVAAEPDGLTGFLYTPDPAYARISCGSNWTASQDGATGKWKVTNSAAFGFAACSVASAWAPGDYFLAGGSASAGSGVTVISDLLASITVPGPSVFNDGDVLQAPSGSLAFFFG